MLEGSNRISIVLPNYNHAALLPTSLGALAAQTDAPAEVIVVDDGSTDDSLGIIDSFRPRIKNLRVIRQKRRGGVAAAVSRGVREAAGDFIFLASADDRIEPDACAAYHEALGRFPQTKLVVSKFTHWWPEENRRLVYGSDSELGMWCHHGHEPAYFGPDELKCLMRRRYVCLATNTACISRQEFLDVGAYDPALKWHADWFAIYAIAFRHGFSAIPKSLAWCRVFTGSYSGRGMRDGPAQREVSLNIQAKLQTPEFRDVDAAIMRAPNAMSTFLRPTMIAMMLQPRLHGRLGRLLFWWLGQFAQAKRPGFLAMLRRRSQWRG